METTNLPFPEVLEIPDDAVRVHNLHGAVNALMEDMTTIEAGKTCYIVTCNPSVIEPFSTVIRQFGLEAYVAPVPDTEMVKGQTLFTIMNQDKADYYAAEVGDAFVWEDPTMPRRHMHVWTIEGFHHGAMGQESVIELSCASHKPPVAHGQDINHFFVPEVLLRGCKVARTKRVTVTKKVGGDDERPAPTIKVEG